MIHKLDRKSRTTWCGATAYKYGEITERWCEATCTQCLVFRPGAMEVPRNEPLRVIAIDDFKTRAEIAKKCRAYFDKDRVRVK